jgi:hypothetical protein
MRGRLSRSCAISKSSRLRPGLDFANELIKRSLLSVALALALFSSSARAAGVDSRVYTCDGLHALLGANRFVFINYPTFMEFVVDNGSYCSAGEMIGLRSAPTRLPKRPQLPGLFMPRNEQLSAAPKAAGRMLNFGQRHRRGM